MSIYDKEVRKFAKEEEKKLKVFKYRIYQEKDDQRGDNRDDYKRDYARVLYSSSFRRLQGKMQLLGIDATNFHRNRLTHSLEVAQIARSIASELHLKHSTIAETCSLGHDIGNPPFGHAGEKVLNELAEKIGGYEGNAQAFRILHRLEIKLPNYSGLNLTIRTLLGITKYFYNKEQNPKKFLYDEDYHFLQEQMNNQQTYITKSIDAQIMDLADEIAYGAHDLEDAISLGFVSLAEMMQEFNISDKYKSVYQEFENIASKSRKVAIQGKRLDTSEEYSFLLRKELTSNIVFMLMRDIGIVECQDGSQQLGYKNYKLLAEGLKKLVFKALLRKKDVQLYEKQGEKIIKGLFKVYTDKSFNRDLLLLPPELRTIALEDKNNEQLQTRIVVDYIASMMDSFAVQEYQRYFGDSSLDILYQNKFN